MFVGQGDGKIVVGAVQQNDVGPTTDYWYLGMHDSKVHLLQLSRDEKYLISAGEDLNIFTYTINAPPELRSPPKSAIVLSQFKAVSDEEQ